MIDRESLYSDPTIIRRLSAEFIPVTGNTHELQNGKSPARDWFMSFAPTLCPRVRHNETAQGFYVVGADGAPCAYINHHEPARVDAVLSEGLAKFRAGRPRPVEISPQAIAAPSAKTPDPTTSVVRVFTRIRPLPPGADALNRRAQRDHLWILADEGREILTASGGEAGFALPRSLVARMVRFHLVDNVRGEPDMWRPEEVRRADFTARRTHDTPPTRTIAFSGVFALRSPRQSHEGKIVGEFDIDRHTAKIVRFRAYSQGQAWGSGTWTGGAPEGTFPLVIAMIETNDAVSRAVSPQGTLWPDYVNPAMSPRQ